MSNIIVEIAIPRSNDIEKNYAIEKISFGNPFIKGIVFEFYDETNHNVYLQKDGVALDRLSHLQLKTMNMKK
jgi:hypothetical protein